LKFFAIGQQLLIALCFSSLAVILASFCRKSALRMNYLRVFLAYVRFGIVFKTVYGPNTDNYEKNRSSTKFTDPFDRIPYPGTIYGI
jgi:hypothetical protein